MDRAVLDAYGWSDIPADCEFLLDYEIDEEEWGDKKKPWRYRWPDEVRDEVLARLLELNAERAKEEASSGVRGGKERDKKTAAKSTLRLPRRRTSSHDDTRDDSPPKSLGLSFKCQELQRLQYKRRKEASVTEFPVSAWGNADRYYAVESLRAVDRDGEHAGVVGRKLSIKCRQESVKRSSEHTNNGTRSCATTCAPRLVCVLR